MLSRIATVITAVSLALTAQASAAAPVKQKTCPGKTHQTTKVAAAKPVKPNKWGGGGAGAQMRRTPDIQILSFGP
ncbi:hypothetical protein [Sphingomonas sp.]|uniref:hypothetical protein n=1 Tax=Sphingomonas sp. TaxID=28214 RepID=UPI0025ED5336|nr:hypothetical protein [Sphingomonas sp.]